MGNHPVQNQLNGTGPLSDHFHPIADPLFGRPCLAIHVQPHLAQQAQAELHRLQRAIARRWPGGLHLAPAHALHVTIYPLVPPAGDFDKEGHWRRIAKESHALVEETGRSGEPFALHFVRLKVMPVGIIAVAEDGTGFVGAIRRRIVETLSPPPGLAHRHYDLVHTTLARFQDTRPVPVEFVDGIETLRVDVTARVERLKIFRETLYPCLMGEELASIPLARAA